MVAGIGVTFTQDSRARTWRVQSLLENFSPCRKNDSFFELCTGDEILQVLLKNASIITHLQFL